MNVLLAVMWVLIGSAQLALLAAIAYFIAAVVKWRSPQRKPRLIRFGCFLAAVPLLVATAGLWGTFANSRLKQQRVDFVSKQSTRPIPTSLFAQPANMLSTCVLGGGALLATLNALAYSLSAVVGRRSQERKRCLVHAVCFFMAAGVLVAIQQDLYWRVLRPSMMRSWDAAERQLQIARQDHANSASIVQVGDIPPSFTVTATSGHQFALETLRGKVVLISFFATWCGPCLMELPHLQGIWSENRDDPDFAMMVIGREETSDSVAKFLSEHGFSFPMAADPNRAVYSLFARELIPRNYVISKDGRICFASAGFDERDLASLKRELAGQLRSVP